MNVISSKIILTLGCLNLCAALSCATARNELPVVFGQPGSNTIRIITQGPGDRNPGVYYFTNDITLADALAVSSQYHVHARGLNIFLKFDNHKRVISNVHKLEC